MEREGREREREGGDRESPKTNHNAAMFVNGAKLILNEATYTNTFVSGVNVVIDSLMSNSFSYTAVLSSQLPMSRSTFSTMEPT